MENSKRIRIYPKMAVAPYVVYIRRVECPINVFDIADFLNRTYKSVSETKFLNEDKVQITFDNRKEANDFLQSSSSIRSSFHLYAPAHRVEIDGVVYNRHIDPAEVKRNGFGVYSDKTIPAVPILDVCCLAKRSTEVCENKALPAIRITFASTVLPDYLQIRNVLLPVRLFYHRAMLCVVCKKYGHTAQYCRNKICCLKCGRDHPDEECILSSTVCFKCKTEHALLEDCSVLQKKHLKFQAKQRRMRKMMYATLQEQRSHRSKSSPKPQDNRINEPRSTLKTTIKKGRKSSAIKSQPLSSISQLVKLLCETFIKNDITRKLIIALSPAIVQIWKNVIVKYPLIENLISAT